VPYILDQAYAQGPRETIEAAMREIEQDVGSKEQPCVQFVRRSTQVDYLDIHLEHGCISVIGLEHTGPQVSNYSLECVTKGSVMHELLHTLGLYHEMDRYDRDDFLNINFTNLIENAGENFVLKNRSDIETFGTPYDYASIMHYGTYGFAKNPRWPVMTPKPQFAKGTWMGQRSALSRLDVLRVQRLYGCEENTSHIESDISDDKRLLWCDFSSGICDFSTTSSGREAIAEDVQGSSGTARQNGKTLWTVTSRKTPDGPVAGTTNGLDAFFYASKEFAELVSSDTSIGSVETDTTSSKPIQDAAASVTLPEATSETEKSSENEDDSSNATQTSVSLITPMISTGNSSECCINYHVFQTGPSSHMDMYVLSPLIPRTQLFSLRGVIKDHWTTVRNSLQLVQGFQFQLELAIVLDQGSVAIDDLHVTKGPCL
jgi:hypothetical protein